MSSGGGLEYPLQVLTLFAHVLPNGIELLSVQPRAYRSGAYGDLRGYLNTGSDGLGSERDLRQHESQHAVGECWPSTAL